MYNVESLETHSKATVRRLFFAMIPDFRCFSLKLASQHEISFQAAQNGIYRHSHCRKPDTTKGRLIKQP